MKTRTHLAAVVAALAAAGTTLGQAAPPPLGDLTKPPVFLYYLVAFVLLAATVFLSIMPAKRRDQD